MHPKALAQVLARHLAAVLGWNCIQWGMLVGATAYASLVRKQDSLFALAT